MAVPVPPPCALFKHPAVYPVIYMIDLAGMHGIVVFQPRGKACAYRDDKISHLERSSFHAVHTLIRLEIDLILVFDASVHDICARLIKKLCDL